VIPKRTRQSNGINYTRNTRYTTIAKYTVPTNISVTIVPFEHMQIAQITTILDGLDRLRDSDPKTYSKLINSLKYSNNNDKTNHI
jgi:hypothetical protein